MGSSERMRYFNQYQRRTQIAVHQTKKRCEIELSTVSAIETRPVCSQIPRKSLVPFHAKRDRVAQVLHFHVGHSVRAFSHFFRMCVCTLLYTRNAHCGHAMHVPDVRTRVVCVSHVTFRSSPFHSYQQVDGIHSHMRCYPWPGASIFTTCTHIVRSLALCCVRFGRTDSINFFRGTQTLLLAIAMSVCACVCVCMGIFFSVTSLCECSCKPYTHGMQPVCVPTDIRTLYL